MSDANSKVTLTMAELSKLIEQMLVAHKKSARPKGWITLQKAAEAYETTVDALRARVRDEKLKQQKGKDGRIRVHSDDLDKIQF